MVKVSCVAKLKKLLSTSRLTPLGSIKEKSVEAFGKSLGDIRWRPHYLLEDTSKNELLAFSIIYDTECFPDILSQQVERAITKFSFQFFFIVEKESILSIFEENCRQKGFGLILNEKQVPLLVLDPGKGIIPAKKAPKHVGHFPAWLITDMQKISLGTPKFREVLQNFAKTYAKLKRNKELDWEKEEKLVIDAIGGILRSDDKYTSGVGTLKLLRRFESFTHDIRDHYFHSFHIFLLGLLILDHYKTEFTRYYKKVFPRYEDFSPEFLWMLTSIFHDVGYPIAKLDELKEDIYGVSTIPQEKQIAAVWDDHVYRENLKQLISLFKFSMSDTKHKRDWPGEVFGTKDEKLERIFRESFYESHGVAGCFRFLVDIFSEARREENPERKVFLLNHVYPAALSIALHDRIFRERLRLIGVSYIRLSRFPFAVLLGFLDSLQEDRRDKFLCIESPELLQRFIYNGRVCAKIKEKVARRYPRLGKLKIECRGFMNFVECDGIKFEYPKILSL